MNRTSIPYFLALCTLGACAVPESSLGDLPGTSDDGASSPSSAGDDESSGGGGNDIGAPCQTNTVPETFLLELGNDQCGSGMCLYADNIIADPQESCTEDSDCRGFGQGIVCGPAGECQLDPEHVAARSMCTGFCQQDADCVGAGGTACSGGFVCVPMQAIGPACCQKICACEDDTDLISAETLEQACAEGTQPGCCDQDPPGLGCGGA